MDVGMLADIVGDRVKSLRRNATLDWVFVRTLSAKLRSSIKRLLAKHGYPPGAESEATQLVLIQRETCVGEWPPWREG
jgi:type I restriction enzyme R subunit